MYTLVSILGAVSLLLVGMAMVREGMTDSFGDSLRRTIGRFTRNRISALFVGVGVTAILQSSTATALIVSSFASRGLIAGAPSLAVMLGADIGTTLVAQILSFDLSWLSPTLILLGFVIGRTASSDFVKHLSKAITGLGFMLLALTLISLATVPLRESAVLQDLFHSLEQERILALLMMALLTWMTHSSLAMILLIMSLATGGIISAGLALVLVLGANLGGAVPAITATLSAGPDARRVTFSNAFFKLVACVVMFPLIDILLPYVTQFDADPARVVVNYHTLFNLAVALMFILLIDPIYRLAAKLIPHPVTESAGSQSRYLNRELLKSPAMALSCAQRETQHMGDTVYTMLTHCLPALATNNIQLTQEMKRMEKTVDHLHFQITQYVTKLSRSKLDNLQKSKIERVLAFTMNLEHAADIAENIADMASQKAKSNIIFSDDGLSDIVDTHEAVVKNIQLALNVFNTGDLVLARKLLDGEEIVKRLSEKAVQQYLLRLRDHQGESEGTIHLDIIRDLTRINWHITSVVYPVLEDAREKSSRTSHEVIESEVTEMENLDSLIPSLKNS
jgi:phosphate:Na+ symporter